MFLLHFYFRYIIYTFSYFCKSYNNCLKDKKTIPYTGLSERPKSRMGKSNRSTSREKLKNKTKVDNDSEAATVSHNRSTSPKQTLRSRSRTRELSKSSLASEDDGVNKKSDVEFAGKIFI